jgi:hypothetical protein
MILHVFHARGYNLIVPLSWYKQLVYIYIRNAKTSYLKRNNYKWPYIQYKTLQLQFMPRLVLLLLIIGIYLIHICSIGELRPLRRPL